jgi:hypothetical protein
MCGLVCPVRHVNIRMSLAIGSVPTHLMWHGVWLRLIEDTTTARGALASALATHSHKHRRRRLTPHEGSNSSNMYDESCLPDNVLAAIPLP